MSRFDRLGASQETLSDSANANFIRTLFRAADGTIYAGSNEIQRNIISERMLGMPREPRDWLLRPR